MISRTKLCAAVVTAAVTCSAAQKLSAQEPPKGVPTADLGSKYQLLGKTGEPLGKVVELQGVVTFDAPFKEYSGEPLLIVQKVNGNATQRFVFLPLKAYFGQFGQPADAETSLPKLENRASYEFEGYETGGYSGIPWEAYKLSGVLIQGRGFHFEEEFRAVQGRKIPKVAFGPGDFVDREALIEGEAVNKQGRAYLKGMDWELLVDDRASWPEWMEHKTAEAFGTVRRTDAPAVFRAAGSRSRLVKLEDQLGRQVELRGRPRSLNNDWWWFNYRGRKIYVENLEKLPGVEFFEPTVIRGVLERAKLPDLDQITLKERPELKEYFIVRRASAERATELLSPEESWPKRDE